MAIDAGFDHNLALRADGSLVGWGYNFDGQATVPAGNNFLDISAGLSHSVAIARLDPDELILDLIEQVLALNLQHGIENSLDSKLDAAVQALLDGNEENDLATVNTLEAFINAVEAQSGRAIPVADADALIAAALDIIELLLE